MKGSMKMQESDSVIKVIIADDHALFRTGVKTSLDPRKEFKLIGEADNGQQLLHMLKHMTPDIILLDIQMPIMDGITTLPEIKKHYPDVKVVMLTMYNEHSMISKLMELGANAYLTKNSDPEVICEAIKTCYYNEYYFNELTNKALLDGLKKKNQSDINADPLHDVILSDKEKQILRLICLEKSTKEIAVLVNLSHRTVEAIRDKLKVKIGVKSLPGLVLFAVRAGIIEPLN